MSKPLNILEVSASARTLDSASRNLSRDLVDALRQRHGDVDVVRRDLANGVPFVDEDWVAANLTPEEDRTNSQRDKLAMSDELVAELKAADVVVIGAPMYNFNIPATLKAWIDMISRARLTFRYTDDGPRGLLEGKKAYVVVATGGVPVGSPVDFSTPYLRHALGFVGIDDVEFIAADKLNSQRDESLDSARVRIAELVHTVPVGTAA
ncbi:MAG: NAD(P)H-dependent oxidoreductase [Woeseiaceae bacterium]|nr:NAD(P)H-dependent oxidoreductase [Woeseiaceae bacterium]